MLFSGPDNSLRLPFRWGITILSNNGSLGPLKSAPPPPDGISIIGSAVFAGLTRATDTQRDRHTDRATCDLCYNRPHLCNACDAAKNVKYKLHRPLVHIAPTRCSLPLRRVLGLDTRIPSHNWERYAATSAFSSNSLPPTATNQVTLSTYWRLEKLRPVLQRVWQINNV